jgi:plastocyanin
MSNDITISLEKPVPYTVTLKPSSTNIEFIPEEVVFEPHEGQIQTFRISPSKTTAAVGTYAISWVKTENTTTERFSEMVDTFFRVTSKPDYRQLKLTVSQSVYRASVGAQSMPIYVTLSHPASTPMTLYFKTKKPFQPEFVKFSPESITFQPGEKVQMFSYKSMKGAVSGLIELQLQADFADIYYMATPTINFEIEDVDSKPPSIEDYQITDLKMKSASLRVSCDESARVYYICSIKGTITPSPAELTNASAQIAICE